MNKRVEKEINELYKAIFKKVMNSSKSPTKSDIGNIIFNLESSQKYNDFAKRFAKRLAKIGYSKKRGIWKKYYEAAKKLHHVSIPSTYKQFELDIMKNIVINNFKFIKSVPNKILNVYRQKDIDILVEQVAEGKLGRGTFEKELQSHAYKNARLIARTETAKLQTAIDEQGAKSLGSVCYIWKSSNDTRTRQSHKDMNNVVVFWREQGEKPLLDDMRGNAGEFPNCRCTDLPILDEEDLDKSNYEVYDYRSDKVIKMTRNKLIEAIRKKGL